jgi:hypothetical protein
MGSNRLDADNWTDFVGAVCTKHGGFFIKDGCKDCEIESLQAENAELKKPECIWIDEDAYWATGCGLLSSLRSFEADGPAENGVKFCFGCGGKVTIGEQGKN